MKTSGQVEIEKGMQLMATIDFSMFEQPIPVCEEGQTIACVSENSFAREGLKKGLLLQEELGFNPLRFGFVAATDAHNSNPGDAEEYDFRGGSGLFGRHPHSVFLPAALQFPLQKIMIIS